MSKENDVSQEETSLLTDAEEVIDLLAAFEPTQLPVISVYLNLASDDHGRRPDREAFLERELKGLAESFRSGSPERDSFDQDAGRILEYVREELEPSAHGAAIFACHGAGNLFEAFQLRTPFPETRVYVYNQPHLYQLARVEDENPRAVAVVADSNFARIFTIELGGTVDVEEVKSKKRHRVKVGGWSQARYQRRVGNAQREHVEAVIERLVEVVREEESDHIVLAADASTLAVFEERLPQEFAQMLQTITLDTRAPEEDVMAATIEALREADTKSDAEKVQRLLDYHRGHGLGIAGLQQTLKALAAGQVDELVIATTLEEDHPDLEQIKAMLAPEIPDARGETESNQPRKVSLPDLLVTKARQTDAEVTFIQDPELLKQSGGVGAFLRWRT